MFTRNYWMAFAANMANQLSDVTGEETTTGKPKLISVSGEVGADAYNGTYKYKGTQTAFVNSGLYRLLQEVKSVDVSKNTVDTTDSNYCGPYGCLIFGSGNTIATIDDYKLAGDVIDGFTYSYVKNFTYAEDGSSSAVSYTYTITNNNDADITIGEIGLFVESRWKVESASKYTHYYYMIERTALETPITIAPGSVGQVEYTIRMNYPVPTATE